MGLLFVPIPRTSSEVFEDIFNFKEVNVDGDKKLIRSVGHSWLYPTKIKGWRDWDFPNQKWGVYRDVDVYSIEPADRLVTIIRNPFDLLFSYFKYDWAWCRSIHKLSASSDTKENFQKFVDIYLDDSIEFHAPAFKKSMFSQLKDEHGTWVLSKSSIVMRHERLGDDIRLFAKLTNTKLKHPLSLEETEPINILDFYRYDQIQKLSEIWKDDLEYLGYTIEEKSTKVNTDKPRVALCLSGLIRDVEYTKGFWTNLIDKYDIDVYGSFWDDENKKTKDTIENLKSIYNFKEVEFEKYSNFKKSTLDIITPYIEPTKSLVPELVDYAKSFHTLSMWYKVWRANLLSKNLNINYDIVIRGRIDTIVKGNLDITKNDYLNLPSGFVKTHGWENSEGISDIFAYGKPKLMDYYSSMYINILEYVNQGHYMIPPENLLRVHMSRVDVKLRFFKYKLIITRFSKGSPDEVYDKTKNVIEQILPSNFAKIKPRKDISFISSIRKLLKF